LVLLAQRRGESGAVTALASFFKSPLGVKEHDLSVQFGMLEGYLET
jgi:myo-inositol-1-phosphate synthase